MYQLGCIKDFEKAQAILFPNVSMTDFLEESSVWISKFNNDLVLLMGTGIIQSDKGTDRSKWLRKGKFVLRSGAGVSILSCSWIAELQIFVLWDYGTSSPGFQTLETRRKCNTSFSVGSRWHK